MDALHNIGLHGIPICDSLFDDVPLELIVSINADEKLLLNPFRGEFPLVVREFLTTRFHRPLPHSSRYRPKVLCSWHHLPRKVCCSAAVFSPLQEIRALPSALL